MLLDPVKSAEPPKIGILEFIKCKTASEDFLVACGELKFLNSLDTASNNFSTLLEKFFKPLMFFIDFLDCV